MPPFSESNPQTALPLPDTLLPGGCVLLQVQTVLLHANCVPDKSHDNPFT